MLNTKTKLKIAQLGPAHPYRGGIVHFNNALAQAFAGRGDVETDQYFWSKPYPKSLLPGTRDYWLDTKSCINFQVDGKSILNYTNPLTWLKLARHLHKGNYDLFITHWVHPIHFPVLFFLFLILKFNLKLKIILIVHNVRPHENFIGHKTLFKIIAKFAHKIIIHSSGEFQKSKKLNIEDKKIKLLFHPTYDIFKKIDYCKASSSNIPRGKKIFLFFGFVRPYKGLNNLITAFKILLSKRDDVLLLIVGENFCHNFCSKQKEKNIFKTKNIVHIDRYVTNEEVGSYFENADALVVPYVEASQSGPIQIAYAFNKPVIASNIPAFRDCVEPGTSGYLFEAGNCTDLVNAMEHFLDNPIDPKLIEEYRKRFTWGRYTDAIIETNYN